MELWQGAERRATRLIMIMAVIDQLCASTAIINYAPTVILSLQGTTDVYNGTNTTTGMCMGCSGTVDLPLGACGQWGYGDDPWIGVSYAAADSTGLSQGLVWTCV